MIYNYQVKGLNCANCAAKIESEINEIPGVIEAQVNLVQERLRVDLDPGINEAGFRKLAEAVVNQNEPDIVFTPMTDARVVKPGIQSQELQGEAGQDALDHGHDHGHSEAAKLLPRLSVSLLFFLLGFIPALKPVAPWLYVAAYLISGYDVLAQAGRNLLRGRVFDEYFLMSLATIGAVAIGDLTEAAAVMIFWQIGEYLQALAMGHSRNAISSLLELRPDEARQVIDPDTPQERLEIVSPESLVPGDLISVQAGERIPLDGKVVRGTSSLNTSALTGESMPVDCEPGDEVLSGSVNLNGLLRIEVTKAAEDSTVSRMLDLVENASLSKAKTERFITRFARYYTPIVVFLAIFVAFGLPLILQQAFKPWIYKGLSFLIVSCPCALIVSIPISYFGGLGAASTRGILIKGSQALEKLEQLDTIVLDKTGTLTQGQYHLSSIVLKEDFATTKEREQHETEILMLAALLEGKSNHPIARSICEAAEEQALGLDSAINYKGLTIEDLEDLEEQAGFGIRAKLGGSEFLLGNGKLLKSEGVSYEQAEETGTVVYIAEDGHYLGHLLIQDTVKPEAFTTLTELHNLGVSRLVLLTGDRPEVAQELAKQLPLDEVHAGLLPEEKVEHYQAIREEAQGYAAYVGDGINDAPVLASSDLGIAMGGLGSDAAIEAADVVLMTDHLGRIPEGIIIAHGTKKIVLSNIILSLGIKVLVLILTVLGITGMGLAVFADVGVTLLAVLNALRTLSLGRRFAQAEDAARLEAAR